MADENRARWTRLVADFESCDLSQREFADERGLSGWSQVPPTRRGPETLPTRFVQACPSNAADTFI
jgi:hypothetical protein